MSAVEILRYAAFTTDPSGGNPAGVVLDAGAMGPEDMLAVARGVGYSETAFLTDRSDAPGEYDVRYFSPRAEVPFCGHATIASAVALAERGAPRDLIFHAAAGPVRVSAWRDGAGGFTASLTSVPPRVHSAPPALVETALAALGWSEAELDPSLPARVADAGARHLILATATRERLADLRYDEERLRDAMLAAELTTVDLIWREAADRYRARNPFPVGGVYEDPATGSAAAALGAYLRHLGQVVPPARITVLQGVEMGRPSRLEVEIPAGDGGVTVSGAAVPIG